jgi:hypothetical protein
VPRHAGFRRIQDQAPGVFRTAADTFDFCGQGPVLTIDNIVDSWKTTLLVQGFPR